MEDMHELLLSKGFKKKKNVYFKKLNKDQMLQTYSDYEAEEIYDILSDIENGNIIGITLFVNAEEFQAYSEIYYKDDITYNEEWYYYDIFKLIDKF